MAIHSLPYASKQAKVFVVVEDDDTKTLFYQNHPIAILQSNHWLELVPGCSKYARYYQEVFVRTYAPNVSLETVNIMRANHLAINTDTGEISSHSHLLGI